MGTTRKATPRGLVLGALIFGLVLGIFSAVSSDARAATITPATQAQIDNDTVQAVVRGFGAVPVQGGNATTASTWTQDIKSAAAVAPSNSAASEVVRGTLKVTEKAGFLGKLRLLSTIGLSEGAFDLGWKIGTGLNAKFFHFNAPLRNANTEIQYTNIQAFWNPQTSQGCNNLGIPLSYCTDPEGYWTVHSGPYNDKFDMWTGEGVTSWPTMNKSPWRHFSENGQEQFGPSACCIWVRSVATPEEFWDSIAKNAKTLPVPYTSQPLNYDTGSNGVTDPGVSATTATLNQKLHSGPNGSCPDDVATFCDFLNSEADPNYPSPVMVPVPKIQEGETYTQYAADLSAVGLQPQKKVLGLAEKAFGANEPVWTVPAPTVQVKPGVNVDVWVNPTFTEDSTPCPVGFNAKMTDPQSTFGWAPPNINQYTHVSGKTTDNVQIQNQYPANDGVTSGNNLTAILQWGRHRLDPLLSKPEGWGLRHIWYAHGYSSLDQTRVTEALTHVPVIVPDNDPISWHFYEYWYKGNSWNVNLPKGGKGKCQQLVKVQFFRSPLEQEHGWNEQGILDTYAIVAP